MMSALSCASESRKSGKASDRNRDLIFSSECLSIFTRNEKTLDEGGTSSSCYFRCDPYSGELTLIGDKTPDHKMLPNCVVLKSRTSSVINTTRKIIYYVHCTGLSPTAIAEIASTEYEINKSYITHGWRDFTRLKLKSIYDAGGWWELYKWAKTYKETLNLDDTVWDLMFK